MIYDTDDLNLRFIYFKGGNKHEIPIRQDVAYFVVLDAKGMVSLLSEYHAGALERAVALLAYEPSARKFVINAYTPPISRYESALETGHNGVRLSTARVSRGELVSLFYWRKNAQNGSTLTKKKPGTISFKIDIT